MAFAVYGMAVVLAPAIGPTLGGYITDNFSWRWIFYINLPVGLLSLYLTRKIVEDPPYMAEERKKILGSHIDYLGLGLITLGVGFLQYVFDKGQEDDWFSSRTIFTLTVSAVVLIIWFIVQELRHDNPILDLRLLKSRNFATSTFLMFVLGMVLFGTTVLIPQFLQVLMGYSAQTAGMALSSGAVVMIVMMPIVGRLVGKVDARYLAAFGFSVTALALYHMTALNLQIDFKTAAFMRIYQTIGLAFIFIPINTLSYVGMQPNKSNQVAGITNLARNLGGSIGISLLGTFVARYSQQHQVYLTAHMTPADPAFTQRINAMTQAFIRQGLNAEEATRRAYAVIGRIAGGQALTLAYVDIVSAMALGVACLVPLIFMMKKPKRGAAPAAAH
jgi:DHA2 family multidrug resistance protein